jgi:hypothetical protein
MGGVKEMNRSGPAVCHERRSAGDGVIDRAVRILRGLLIEEHRCYPPGAGDWQPVALATRPAIGTGHYTCPECSQVWSAGKCRSAA